ncbi:hypothetical protein BC937DRAFT_94860 [Endogone sp. FLAS-F59071]|nr:hypothetical protein BC937DRAFT_94860 [Endogone sp. FLAS-F59071]|eukprot:RUS22931.1 hypothetical protein BC937DRAFT_94860 [Endogone sp. FLAS-F59071]
MTSESLIMRALCSTHGLDHFFAEFHGWWERFWIAAENEPKVDVEEVAVRGEKEIVEVAVANTEEIGDNAIASWGLRMVVEELILRR